MVDNFKLVDLSDELMDDNGSDRESYFSDSEFENDPNTIAHLQLQLQQTPVMTRFSLLAILAIF